MEAEVGTPINYDPNDFMNKEEDHQPDEQKPEPENNEQYYFPPPTTTVLRTVSTTGTKGRYFYKFR